MKKLFGILSLLLVSCVCWAESEEFLLPTPNLKNDATLKSALERRSTNRNFSIRALSELEIANLLWAAYGENRPDGKRTVPAAMGIYAIEIFVALPDGVYSHDRGNNSLRKISSEDIRAASDGRKMGAYAPLVLIMVADKEAFGEKGERFAAMEAGAIMQNIYLFCAGYNFNTVACGSFDNETITRELKLPANKYVMITQIVGCPR